jgi:hypothetical protein
MPTDLRNSASVCREWRSFVAGMAWKYLKMTPSMLGFPLYHWNRGMPCNATLLHVRSLNLSELCQLGDRISSLWSILDRAHHEQISLTTFIAPMVPQGYLFLKLFQTQVTSKTLDLKMMSNRGPQHQIMAHKAVMRRTLDREDRL